LNRENKLTALELESIKRVFVEDWKNYLQIENTQVLMEHAVDLAEAFALRAYDSVHLAAAAMLAKQSSQEIGFACFDQHLNKAAKILGLQLSGAIA
jgi:predicted nucleic acid-binding protein